MISNWNSRTNRKMMTWSVPCFLSILCAFLCCASVDAQTTTPTWIWAKNAGGARTSRTNAIAVDGSDNVIAAGYFSQGSLSFGTSTVVSSGNVDAWVSKYNSAGTLQWAAKIGSTGNEYANAVTTDASGNIYFCGYYTSSTLAIGTTTLTNAGGNDIFIAKYDASGNFQWAQGYGNTGNETATGVATDASGNVFMVGYYGSGTTLTIGSNTLTNSGNNDFYVAQFNSSGTVQWARRFGGTSNDYATSVRVDHSDNVIVSGYFGSSSMVVGTTTLSTTGSNDCFIGKLSNSGTVSWALKFGGTSADQSNAISIDASDNIYAAGFFYSATMAVGTTTLTNGGTTSYQDAFVCSYNASGTAQWAARFGGTNNDYANGVSVDGSGNVFLTMAFTSATIAVGATTYTNGSYSGSQDYIVAKLGSAGAVSWSAYSSANASTVWGEIPYAAATDASGNIIFGGGTGTSFTVGSVTVTTQAGDDAFLIKYNSSGTPQWGKDISTPQGTNGTSVWADAAGNAYACGNYNTSTMIVGASTLRNNGMSDVVVIKYDPTGNPLWATGFGASGNDYANAIAEDGSGNVFVGGYFVSSTLTLASSTLTNAGSNDAYLAKLDGSGNPLWGLRIGGTGSDVLQTICTDPSGNAYVAGYFANTVVIGTNTLTSSGGSDIFVAKIDGTGAVIWARKYGGTSTDVVNSICMDASGNLFIAGYFTSSSLALGTSTLATAGSNDGFVAKLNSSGVAQWGSRVGSTGSDVILDVSVSPSAAGYIAVCGYFTSTSLAIGTTTLTNGGGEDGFCTNFNASGSPIWSSQQAGAGNERAVSIGNTSDGDVYWCAYFGSNSVTVGTSTLTNASTISSGPTVTGVQPSDMYFIKQDDTTGNYSPNLIQVGGTSSESPSAIYIDASANLYVTGSTWSSPLTFGTIPITFTYGSSPMFVAKLTNLNTLPIELLSFDAAKQDRMALLTWATATEHNNSYFVVEQSTDAKNFRQVGKVSAAGNSLETKHYSLRDSLPSVGINYYRLKQVDFDGHYSYSAIRSLNFDDSGLPVKIYPNPAKGMFVIESHSDESLDITIYSETGMDVYHQVIGSGKALINAMQLGAGVYTVLIKSSSTVTSQKLVIQQ
ncbi:MAG: SBBP repeat-containing protein [Bacteroidetes bacterium]|nr:SBBP repeat-containing protein [Bacteroidota bacterium]